MLWDAALCREPLPCIKLRMRRNLKDDLEKAIYCSINKRLFASFLVLSTNARSICALQIPLELDVCTSGPLEMSVFRLIAPRSPTEGGLYFVAKVVMKRARKRFQPPIRALLRVQESCRFLYPSENGGPPVRGTIICSLFFRSFEIHFEMKMYTAVQRV